MQVCNDSPMESEIQSHRATLRDVEIEIPQRVLKQNLPLEPYFATSSQLNLLPTESFRNRLELYIGMLRPKVRVPN